MEISRRSIDASVSLSDTRILILFFIFHFYVTAGRRRLSSVCIRDFSRTRSFSRLHQPLVSSISTAPSHHLNTQPLPRFDDGFGESSSLVDNHMGSLENPARQSDDGRCGGGSGGSSQVLPSAAFASTLVDMYNELHQIVHR